MDVEAFIARWSGLTGGAERANYAMFLCELCAVLDLPCPDPASARHDVNDYVFERMVRPHDSETGLGPMRIDLYRRDAFVLEAKQSRWLGQAKAVKLGRDLSVQEAGEPRTLGRRSGGAGWDALMAHARRQAEHYVTHLPTSHRTPPFVLVCDVGHVIEIYADFSGSGRDYTPFPDRRQFRIYLEDLRDPTRRERLRRIWLDPWSLDPDLCKAEASRDIAERLGELGRRLEASGYAPKAVAQFLMRCIFTMYACNMDLLPEGAFTRLLVGCRGTNSFVPMVGELWRRMRDPLHEGRFFSGFGVYVRHFGGKLFLNAEALKVDDDALETLIEASRRDWSNVEPSIFGVLMEQALEKGERRAYGVHYTPRHHVERLVQTTLIEPLRDRWDEVFALVGSEVAKGRARQATRLVLLFHRELCAIRVLDPACGAGNFLYIALDLLKRLESEVLETLAQLGATELLGVETLDPSNFIGLEINSRAAVIAELVLMLGYLQIHYRTRSGHPAEPILRDFGSVREMDAIVDLGAPVFVASGGGAAPRTTYPHASRPDWPEADYIIGNPPFVGGKDLRLRLGDAYAQALWAAHPQMNPGADLVMYWWDRAAERLTRPGSRLRRFGFVTTNSITQRHQRQVVRRWLTAPRPLRLVWALPDAPWSSPTRDAAAVRVAMTVAEAGSGAGRLAHLASEKTRDAAQRLTLHHRTGVINADLSLGPDLGALAPLRANRGLCSPGVKLHGSGFIVRPEQGPDLGLGRRPGLETYVRPYLNGRDVMGRSRDAWVIDLYPLASDTVRARFPEVYQHLLARVKPERDRNRMTFRRENWWWFGATHETYRGFIAGLPRYIATPETAKHRVFVFLDAGTRADNMIVSVGSDDAFHLGVLSSSIHRIWARTTGAVLEDRPRYTKTACFDPFPFPDPPSALRDEVATLAETLEATRREVLAEHADLTLTGLYNAMDAVRAGAAPGRERALILIELHRRIDAAVARAYGWDADIAAQDVLARLAALNVRRRAEEAAGHIRWLRRSYQRPRVGDEAKSRQAPRASTQRGGDDVRPRRPIFPTARLEQPLAIWACLRASAIPLSEEDIASRFSRAGRAETAIRANLRTLTLYGYIEALADGRYLARQAA